MIRTTTFETTARFSRAYNVHLDRLVDAARIRTDGGRFLAFAIANTSLTYTIYCGLVWLLPAQVAYAVVYALGIALAYAGNARWVFRVRPRLATAAIYPVFYLLQYALTAGLLKVLMDYGSLGHRLALAVAIVMVVPFSFFFSRWILRSESSKTRATRSSAS
jgi:putative flippase GtrA